MSDAVFQRLELYWVGPQPRPPPVGSGLGPPPQRSVRRHDALRRSWKGTCANVYCPPGAAVLWSSFLPVLLRAASSGSSLGMRVLLLILHLLLGTSFPATCVPRPLLSNRLGPGSHSRGLEGPHRDLTPLGQHGGPAIRVDSLRSRCSPRASGARRATAWSSA